MPDADRVFIVVPIYNEEEIIAQTIEGLLAASYHVVAVDDGSLDASWDKIQPFPIHKVRHPINLGQGAAIQTGTTYALRNGATHIVHFDADGQHDATEIQGMLQALREHDVDIVLGSRFLQEETRLLVPWMKRLLLRAAIVFNGLITGLWLSDAHNGFRVLSRKTARAIHIRENDYAHATEILMEIKRNHLTYIEYPTTISYSEYAKQKGQPIWNSINILAAILLRRYIK